MNRLRELREARGVTKTWLARKINVHYNTLTNWESGRVAIPATSLVELSAYFGVSIEYLLGAGEPAARP